MRKAIYLDMCNSRLMTSTYFDKGRVLVLGASVLVVICYLTKLRI